MLDSVDKKLSPEPVLIAGRKTRHSALTTKITKFTKEARQFGLIFVHLVSSVVNK